MQVISDKSNEVHQKERFDEQTKLRLKSLLEELDRKQQSMYQNTETKGKTEYIKFRSDKERKVLLFTGNVDDKPKLAKDYETGLEIPDKYVTRYYFDCYDITTTRNPQEVSGSPGDMGTWSKRCTNNSTLSFKRR